MSKFVNRRDCAGVKLLILAAALLSTAVSQDTTGAQPEQLSAEVVPYLLTKVPGCTVSEGDGNELPAGIFNTCRVQMPRLQQDDPQLFSFTFPQGVQMSATFTIMVQGGTASMSIWYPGSPVTSPPDLKENILFSSPASSEGWITIPTEDLATRSGTFLLAVSAFSGTPDVVITVETPPSTLQLIAEERQLLAGVAEQCCKGDEDVQESPFCAAIAPRSLSADHSWFEDMCHLAPSSCNADGQLVKLALPGLGLKCDKFPQQIAGLTALTRLDLSGNSFSAATMEDVVQVVSGLSSLQELSLGSTGLRGSLTCDIATPAMKVVDLAYNFLEGSVPSCLINILTELYVPGNALTGPLPAPASSSVPLTTLYANIQRGAGLTGTIPVGWGSMRNLRFMNVAGNSLAGALPGMTRGLQLMNVSDNNLSGRLGSLPAGIWNVDVGGNDFTGPLPALSALNSLEVFVANSNRFEGRIPHLPAGLHHFEASGCGLSGPLPALPASIRRFDVADNAITGTVTDVDVSGMEVFRASNNQLTGGVPPSAASSPVMFLLDLGNNRLTGQIPQEWSAPRMQMVMLENNTLTGTIPSSLAALPRLGVLRLANNKLTGNLQDFAAQLKDPKAATDSSSSGPNFSNLFDFNVSSNQLTGPVPSALSRLGVFYPNFTVIVPGAHGGPSIAPRVMDLSDNKIEGDWPTWLLDAVPGTTSVCHCSVFIDLSGPHMKLTCPPQEITVTDYAWQLAAEQRYRCWSDKESQAVQLLDQLTSAANSNDKIDTTSMARGDGGGYRFTIGGNKADSKTVAGVVIGVIGGVTLLAVVGYFVVYKRFMRPEAKATAFSKFVDEPAAGPAAVSSGGAGGAISMTQLPNSQHVDGAAAHADAAAAAAARPM